MGRTDFPIRHPSISLPVCVMYPNTHCLTTSPPHTPLCLPTLPPLSSCHTLPHFHPPLPSPPCRNVSVWSLGEGKWLRQCWSTALTRSSSLAALWWVALSCRQRPSTSPQWSWSSEERGESVSGVMNERGGQKGRGGEERRGRGRESQYKHILKGYIHFDRLIYVDISFSCKLVM